MFADIQLKGLMTTQSLGFNGTLEKNVLQSLLAHLFKTMKSWYYKLIVDLFLLQVKFKMRSFPIPRAKAIS